MPDVVIAGGSGGLGSAVVERLASEWRVIFSYLRNAQGADALAGFGVAVKADLLVDDDRLRLLDAAPELYGLVVMTGIATRGGTAEDHRRSHELNFLGPVLLAREAAERMKRRGTKGAIILLSTMQATAVFPGSTAYAAQKAALIHAGRVLAKECRGPHDIRVNVICPGVNQAGMAEASIAAGKYDVYLKNGA